MYVNILVVFLAVYKGYVQIITLKIDCKSIFFKPGVNYLFMFKIPVESYWPNSIFIILQQYLKLGFLLINQYKFNLDILSKN